MKALPQLSYHLYHRTIDLLDAGEQHALSTHRTPAPTPAPRSRSRAMRAGLLAPKVSVLLCSQAKLGAVKALERLEVRPKLNQSRPTIIAASAARAARTWG